MKSAPTPLAKPGRDLRLDLFRGIAMLIIFIAHVPLNRWNDFIPARFGPSDATEMFVFCSGFASSLAFGTVFRQRGFLIGTARLGLRCWQVYGAHLGLFFAVAAACVVGTDFLGTRDYVGDLNLTPFFEDPRAGLVHLLTLTYVPNLFDILPMYLGVLAMLPIVATLGVRNPAYAAAFVIAVYGATWAFGLGLPAEWWSDREWFFNPLGWQLLFFTGFAFGSRWLTLPKPRRWLFWLSGLFVLFMIPVSYWPVAQHSGVLREVRVVLWWSFEKTDFGIVRYIHFLALAYLAATLVGHFPAATASRLAAPVIRIGQQSLSVFLSSIFLARIAGMILDVTGRTALTYALINLTGFVSLYLIARFMAFMKSAPWRSPRAKASPAETPTLVRAAAE